MKESKLVEMRNKIESQTRVIQQLINEIGQLKTLVISLLEIIKRLKEYESIVKQIKDDREADNKKAKK